MSTQKPEKAMNNRALAVLIASSARYTGGHIYPGAVARIIAPGVNPEGLAQPIHSAKEADRRPRQGIAAHNKRILASTPIGAEIGITDTYSGGTWFRTWVKIGPCRWRQHEACWISGDDAEALDLPGDDCADTA